MPFVKIYDSILRSSVWLEDPPTRIIWLTLLALADQDGHVEAAVPGLAHTANIPLKVCRRALKILESPDPESKDPEHDGRRIEKVSGGWLVLNYRKYREMPSPSAIRMRRHRAKQEASQSDDVTPEAEAEAEAEERRIVRGPDTPASIEIQGEVHNERMRLEGKLFALVREIRDRTGKTGREVMKQVTSYDTKDGRRTAGVEDPALLRTIDAVEKSIADAAWWIEELNKGKDGGDGKGA